MSDFIYFAGRQVPIHMPSGASVKSFVDNANLSFYAGGASAPAPAQDAGNQANADNQAAAKPSRCYGIRNEVANASMFQDFNSLYQAANDPTQRDAYNTFVGGLSSNGDDNKTGIYQLAIHYDVTNDPGTTFRVLKNKGISTHFVIAKNGDLYQFLDCAHVAWATNNCNAHSIAIDLNNPVHVPKKDKDKLGGRTIERGMIQGKMHEMLGYTDKQFDTMVALIKALTSPVPGVLPTPGDTDWIPLRKFSQKFMPPSANGVDIIDHLIKDAQKFEGMIGHYHCNPEKIDPGPAFDWHRILRGLSGAKNSLPLAYKGDYDIGKFGNGINKAFQYFYTTAEKVASGGWYPIGANQSWHSGIHLATKEKEPVYNMIEGRIIAVRNVRHSDLGDPSFVLVEHTRNHPADKDKAVHFYTLYMHLSYWSEKASKCDIPWMKTLLGEEFNNADSYFGFDRTDDNLHKMPPKYLDELPEDKKELHEKFFKGYILPTNGLNLEVKPGDLIGYAGRFANVNQFANEDTDGYDDLPSMIHLETFSADRPTDLFVRKETDMETWTIIEGASHEMSKAMIKTLLNPIKKYVADREGAVPSLLKTSEIADFYGDDESEETLERFRRFITLHISEWSPDMNWTDTAINSVGWQWESEKSFGKWYVQWIPFQWMSSDLLDALGIELDNGRVYTYNPIYLLEQLNKTFSGVSSNAQEADKADIDRFQNEVKAKLDDAKRIEKLLKKENREPTEQEKVILENAKEYLDDSSGLKEGEYEAAADWQFDDYDLKSTDFNKHEPGEWPVPTAGKSSRDDDEEEDE